MFEFDAARLDQINEDVLSMAQALGASECSVDVSESDGLSVNVRLGKVETIEKNRDKGLAVTVYLGKRRGSASTSDFSTRSLRQTVQAAYDIARHTGEDVACGLPDPATLATQLVDFDLYHPWDLDAQQAVVLARRIEQASLSTSALITNSEGASVNVSHGQFRTANSQGFRGGYPYSRHSTGCAPIAADAQGMQRDDWYSSAATPLRLAQPETIGRYAAQRALSRLGARSLSTRKVPVLFEAPLAGGLIGHLVAAASGSALYRRSSFLLDALGTAVLAPHLDLVEDPHLPGESGSSSFDSEGVATSRRFVVSAGQLQGYFLSTYSARKLGMTTTGNAGGAHNLALTSRLTRQLDDLPAMLQRLHTGLFVTDLMGQGVNLVTGDYSRGARGFWVERGQIRHPVEEITIAGNLREMLTGIVAVGSDVITRGSRKTGSILIESMSVAGA
jgi:PmbA protein